MISSDRIRAPLLIAALGLLLSCAKKPPPDFAPDPELVARIRHLEIVPAAARVCPGQAVRTTYAAVLDDGTRVPFAREYDKDHPPRLHVVFLDRRSDQARPQQDGDWTTHSDPLVSVATGFRLETVLRARPDVRATHVLPPSYECTSHEFRFVGATGETGGSGSDGPDVTVRLSVVRSPFYERLLVGAIEAGHAALSYVLYDAESVPPSDWLLIESAGGAGGRGTKGARGAPGPGGRAGCPGERGATGGFGGTGGPGGLGGRGGRVTIIAPQEEPFLAGVVDVENPGGQGGAGGPAGEGGEGGAGGPAERPDDPQCRPGVKGETGGKGAEGPAGRAGRDGPRPTVITVPARDVFGSRVPPELEELLWPSTERR